MARAYVHFLVLVLISSCGGAEREFLLDPATQPHALRARDPALTPGALCSVESQDFMGWAREGRFPRCRRNVSIERKHRVKESYGVRRDEARFYEIDHFIPLSIGGSNETGNLWPMPDDDAHAKAQFELLIFERVSAGDLTQDEAIEEFRARW